MTNNNQQAFLELVRAGLWEKEARLSQFKDIDYSQVLRLAETQAVVGLVAAGIEHVVDTKVPQVDVLQFVGQTIQIEQRNVALNAFIANLVDRMRAADIYIILVKGQGVAQCYERPLWRASGDVDLLLSDDNYKKAVDYLERFSSNRKDGGLYSKEVGLTIDSWFVEVHGSLRTGLSTTIDREVDAVQGDVFYGGNVRSWKDGNTIVFLPSIDNDVFFVFTHFIKHFYKEGMTLRQVCDWCRLLWKYRDKVDISLLKKRLVRSGLMSEWRAFATVAVEHLGMPVDAMPLYSKDRKWHKKACKIISFILKEGERRKLQDTLLVGTIFPLSTLRFAPGIMLNVNWMKVKERLF